MSKTASTKGKIGYAKMLSDYENFINTRSKEMVEGWKTLMGIGEWYLQTRTIDIARIRQSGKTTFMASKASVGEAIMFCRTATFTEKAREYVNQEFHHHVLSSSQTIETIAKTFRGLDTSKIKYICLDEVYKSMLTDDFFNYVHQYFNEDIIFIRADI